MTRDFSATTDEIDVGTWNVGAIQAFTMGAWIYVDSQGGSFNDDTRFIAKQSSTSSANHYWMLGQTKASATYRWRVRFRAGATPATDTVITGPSTLGIGQWDLAIFDYDGTNMRLDVNNSNLDTSAHSAGGNMDTSSAQIYIGNGEGGNLAPDGSMAEVFVLSTLLNPAQKTALYNGAVITDLVPAHQIEAYYPLDEPGVFVEDKSIHARHGVALGTIRSVGPPPRVNKVRDSVIKTPWYTLLGSAAAANTKRTQIAAMIG
jgi:hypothetical protein